jgi:hypothetical protein
MRIKEHKMQSVHPIKSLATVIAILLLGCGVVSAQTTDSSRSDSRKHIGSATAKAGFQNEDAIRDRFNNWRTDPHARVWLEAMNYSLSEVLNVSATKPHGGKADVEVAVETNSGKRTERISIKLVSSERGFNQIDKRWLATYAEMWDMPPNVITAMKLFVGETPPRDGSRDPRRMYLNELDEPERQAVLDFFTSRKSDIVSDLLSGDGEHAADWMMVTWKTGVTPKWVIHSSTAAIRFYSDGPVELTRYGNLKLGRVSMQRKGGDNGRDTARMLQFKINPVLLFNVESESPAK